MMPTPSIAKRPAEPLAFRIAPTDGNDFVCMSDPLDHRAVTFGAARSRA